MVGASDEQLDVFNEVWYSILLNTGRFSKGICILLDFIFIYDILLDFFSWTFFSFPKVNVVFARYSYWSDRKAN